MSAVGTALGIAGGVIILGMAMNGGPATNPDGTVNFGQTIEDGAHTGVETAGDTVAQGAKGAVDGALDTDLAKAGLVIGGGYAVGRVGVAIAGKARNSGSLEEEEPSGGWACDEVDDTEGTPCESEPVAVGSEDDMSLDIPEIGAPPVIVFD